MMEDKMLRTDEQTPRMKEWMDDGERQTLGRNEQMDERGGKIEKIDGEVVEEVIGEVGGEGLEEAKGWL